MKSILFLISLSFFASAFSQSKIGVINKNQLLDTLPSRRADIIEIRQVESAAEKERGSMDSVLVVLVEEYQKNASSWSNVLKQYQEARIAHVQNAIVLREKEMEAQLKQINEQNSRRYDDKIKQAVAIVSTKLGLDVVVDSSQTLYFKEKLDITKQVAAELLRIDY